MKKLLVPFNDKTMKKFGGSDFLFPIISSNKVELIGIKSKKVFRYGIVVFVGVDVDSGEVLKKLQENKIDISSDKKLRTNIEKYLVILESSKIGDVLENISENNDLILELSEMRNTPNAVPLP